MFSIIPRIITTTFIILITIGLSWLFFTDKLSLIRQETIEKDFSQIVNIDGKDEYVVAELTTNEDFTTQKYTYVGGLPVGDTTVNLSLVAHYKYYLKFAELTLNVENETVFFHVPKLYLSTPVAFDFSTVQENSSEFLFGADGTELLNQLKNEVSGKLIAKGKLQIGVAYDKAAKALADNFNAHFQKNGHGRYYKNIVVVFSSEHSQSQRQFNYNNSFCGKESCLMELDLGRGGVLTINP
ncbi:hypothetical protein BCS42_03530 [Crenothrix sp. D3]|nr:hypothetical protein BCS42_03530 [Crenothrix sp. D3]